MWHVRYGYGEKIISQQTWNKRFVLQAVSCLRTACVLPLLFFYAVLLPYILRRLKKKPQKCRIMRRQKTQSRRRLIRRKRPERRKGNPLFKKALKGIWRFKPSRFESGWSRVKQSRSESIKTKENLFIKVGFENLKKAESGISFGKKEAKSKFFDFFWFFNDVFIVKKHPVFFIL